MCLVTWGTFPLGDEVKRETGPTYLVTSGTRLSGD